MVKVVVRQIVPASEQTLAADDAIALIRGDPTGYVLDTPNSVSQASFVAAAILQAYRESIQNSSATYTQLIDALSGPTDVTGVDGLQALLDAKLNVAAAADFLKKDGTVALTGDLDAGAHKITSSASPSAAYDLVNKTYADNVAAGSLPHTPVRFVATTGTLATDFDNGKSAGGVTVATGDRFLYAPAAGAITAGVYVAAASGAPTRAVDLDASAEFVPRPSVAVLSGTYSGTKWRCTNLADPTLGSDVLTFVQSDAGGVTYSNGSLLSLSGNVFDAVVSSQGDAEDGTATNGLLTPQRAEQHADAWIARGINPVTAARPSTVPGGIALGNTTLHGEWNFSSTDTETTPDGDGDDHTYAAVTILRNATGVGKTGPGNTDRGLVVQSMRGPDDDSYFDSLVMGQTNALAAYSHQGRHGSHSTILFAGNRAFADSTGIGEPGTPNTEAGTQGIEGNLNIWDADTRQKIINIGVFVGSVTNPHGGAWYAGRGMGFRTTCSQADPSSPYALSSAFGAEDNTPSQSGFENLLSGQQASSEPPYFFVSGGGHPNGRGRVVAQARDAVFPSFSFKNREDDGMFSPVGGAVAWSGAGVEIGRLDNVALQLPTNTIIRIDGLKVLGKRKTGWVMPTGTQNRDTFSPATVTVTQLAQRVFALIADLTGQGIIGA